MNKDNFVGITESGEVAFNLDIFEHLYNANIIITKRLTDGLIDKILENKNKIILHLTITGYGETVLEPFVPSPIKNHEKFLKLIESGFPVEQVVLRIDPIIPTEKGIKRVKEVIELFKDSGITRVRFSILDMYQHVKDRFKENDIKIPYETFHAPLRDRLEVYEMLKDFGKKYNFEVEACGEPNIESISCLSQKDIDILGLTDKIILDGEKKQRKTCHCPSNKKELIRKGKPQRCEHNCLYCFWK